MFSVIIKISFKILYVSSTVFSGKNVYLCIFATMIYQISKCRNILNMNRTPLSYLFLMNVIGNSSWLTQELTPLSVIMVILFSLLSSTIETYIYKILPSAILKNAYLVIIILLHNILGIADYFLVYHFSSVIDLQVIDAILLTNDTESSEFISTFITPISVAITIACCLLVNLAAYLISRRMAKYQITSKIIHLGAALSFVFILVNLILFFSQHISVNAQMHHVLTRVAWGYRHFKHDIKMDSLVQACREVEATSLREEPLTMVVVIGESHSVYHTSLYGYAKQAYPRMSERESEGELFVMQHAVTAHDVTSPTMWSVFSLDSMGNASS